MDLKKVETYMIKQVEELEKALYHYETIMQPRAEADKKILETMRDQLMKIQALKEKTEKGEEVSTDEIYTCVPKQFR